VLPESRRVGDLGTSNTIYRIAKRRQIHKGVLIQRREIESGNGKKDRDNCLVLGAMTILFYR